MSAISKAMLGATAVLVLACAAQAMQPAAQKVVANHDRASGAVLYERYCAGCHNAGLGHPGTMLLEQLGREQAALVGRADLEPDYIRTIVRNGLVEMPPFRPTELTDAELNAVIAHIKQGTPAPKVAKKPTPKVAKK